MPWPGPRGYLELSDDAGSPFIAGVTHVTDTSCGPAAGTSCGFPLTLRAALHLGAERTPGDVSCPTEDCEERER